MTKSSAFTLIELLVVIAIIAVLATLGLSVASAMNRKAQATKCLASLGQVGVAMRAYVNDHDGNLPDTGHVRAEDGTSLSWVNTLGSYLGPNFIGRCAASTKSRLDVTYGWNDLLTTTTGEGIPVARCQAPSTTFAVAEISDTYGSEHFHFSTSRSRVTYNQFKAAVGVDRHGKSASYVFADGHAESLTIDEVKSRLTMTNTTFITP